MNIICHACSTKLNISDHKLPKDKETTVTCPKCKGKIQIPPLSEVKPQPSVQEPRVKPAQRGGFEDRINALVCMERSEMRSQIASVLEQMGLHCDIVFDSRSAFGKMEYNTYQLLILDDDFDSESKGTASILERMNAIDMSQRRKLCIVLVSRKFNTNDNMAALHLSINSIIHQGDVPHMESFLSRTFTDHKNLYSIFNESLKLAGKA